MAADSGRPKNLDPNVAKANLLGALENIGGFLKENVAPSFLGGGLRAKDRVPFNESLNTLLGGELPSRGQLGAEGFAELIGAMVPIIGRRGSKKLLDPALQAARPHLFRTRSQLQKLLRDVPVDPNDPVSMRVGVSQAFGENFHTAIQTPDGRVITGAARKNLDRFTGHERLAQEHGLGGKSFQKGYTSPDGDFITVRDADDAVTAVTAELGDPIAVQTLRDKVELRKGLGPEDQIQLLEKQP